MQNAQNSISGIYFMAKFSGNDEISNIDSRFETFWVLGDPKSTKFCLLLPIHASCQGFCWVFGKNAGNLHLSWPKFMNFASFSSYLCC